MRLMDSLGSPDINGTAQVPSPCTTPANNSTSTTSTSSAQHGQTPSLGATSLRPDSVLLTQQPDGFSDFWSPFSQFTDRANPGAGLTGQPIAQSTATPKPVPSPAPLAKPQVHAGSPPAHKPAPPKQPDTSPLSGIESWTTKEWSTVAGFAHGMISAPGQVSRSWSAAATANEQLASKLEHTVDAWGKDAASVRRVAISDIEATAHGASSAVDHAVATLSSANSLPQFIENQAGRAHDAEQALLHTANSVKTAVGNAIDRLPTTLQSPLRALATKAETTLEHGYASVKTAAKQFYNENINTLSQDTQATLRSTAHDLEDVATQQASHVDGAIARQSRLIGTTLSEVPGASIVEKVPVLRDIPVLGVVLAGASTAADIHDGVDPGAAVVANAGSTVVATAVGSAVSEGLAGVLGGAAISDGAATAVGAVAATGPVGWAVAGGVVAGAAVGYGIYKAVESKAGQDVISGIEHFDGKKIEQGLGEAKNDVVHMADDVASTVASWF